ncbi:hypothetical protein C0992_011910 [Termitomyces sp. T32_za158]|nr:hypothetical protein C0992_011910 [Termitomyces sp. T32_za158]
MELTSSAGCFSNFSLKNLLPRRSKSKSTQVTATFSKAFNGPSWSIDDKHGHHPGLCSGGDWILTPGRPSYSAPPEYTTNGSIRSLDPEVVKTVESKLDELDPQLRELSLELHSHPEIAFQENYAHDVLTAFLEKHDFQVTRHYAGLETAWRAEYSVGQDGRVLGVNSEMDALPGIGHACGHNLIAMSGVGIAIAVKTALVTHGIPGKIVILGTPAEESGGGKILLLEKGGYKDMDVCIMSHPAPGEAHSAADGPTNAAQTMFVEYTGKTAHAADSPWEGINALDAAVSAYNSISSLRQQLKPELRVHGIIEGLNWVPNGGSPVFVSNFPCSLSVEVIPDNAKLTYIARAPNKTDLVDLVERIKRCFNAAALATGCGVNIEMNLAYLDLWQNPVLAREFGNTIVDRYDMTSNHLGSSASTDFGNVTYGGYYSFHPIYGPPAIPTEPNGGNHTPKFTCAAQTMEAHVAAIKVTKGLALTGLRVLSDELFFEEVKAAFDADKEARVLAKPDSGMYIGN